MLVRARRWQEFGAAAGQAVLTLLGLLVYGTVAFSYVTFFSAFDVSLEEVGLSYATLLRRSGLYLAVVVASLIIAAPFLSFFGDRRTDHRRGAYAIAALLLVVMGWRARSGSAPSSEPPRRPASTSRRAGPWP